MADRGRTEGGKEKRVRQPKEKSTLIELEVLVSEVSMWEMVVSQYEP